MAKTNKKEATTLVNLDNYGPFRLVAEIQDGVITVVTDMITKENWDEYYNSLLNILKDGIYTEYVQSYKATVIFHNGVYVNLSLIDLYFNIIMWRLLVFSDSPIESYHIFYHDELTADNIKEYIDDYFIDLNRTRYGNKVLSNMIADTLQKFHDIDQFAMYLSNTLNLEDTVDLMNLDEEYNETLHVKLSGLPIDEIKGVAMNYAEKSVERIKKAKDKLGYDHCLADAWRAREGINIKQYMEVAIGIGSKPDGRGGIFNKVVDTSFANGGIVDPTDYFIESSTSRISQIIKFKSVSTSGTFARIMGLNNMDSFLYTNEQYDCHTHNPIPVEIKSAKHLKFLNLRYYREHPNGIEKCIDYKKDKHLIGTTIYLRSPITCASAANGHGICYKCYGKLAYSVYDSQQQFGINIGRIASELITAKLTQMQLSVKHILEAKIEKVTWIPIFYDLFELTEDLIQLNSLLENPKDYRILIDPDEIDLENEGEDTGISDDDEIAILNYNEYIIQFDVLRISTGEVYHISNDKDEKLYLTNEFNGIIRKKGEPIEGKISIGFNEIKDTPLFIVQVQNNEITKTLEKLKKLFNKSSEVKGKSIMGLLQEIIDTNIEAGMNIANVHYEIILMNQIRDIDDILNRPDWNYTNPPYQILTLNEALNNNPSITISLSYQKIMKMFYTPLTYRKRGPSFMDLFFMEKPQRVIRGIDEIKELPVRLPGELYEPVLFTEDPNKVTGDEDEEVFDPFIEDDD